MKYEERVVAFIDILGFKNSVEQSLEYDTEFDRILNTLNELKEFFSPNKYNTQTIQVSDSLIISRLSNDPGGIYDLITDCAFAVHLLINNGYLCRGAIKLGYTYHKKSTIFGKAYIDAYVAEAKERLPIIKFDKNLLKAVMRYPGLANIGHENWEIEFITKDCKLLPTGEYYLDYFDDYDNRVGGGNGEASIHYYKLREIIVAGLESKLSSVYQKYEWAAEQFNKTAQKYNLDKIVLGSFSINASIQIIVSHQIDGYCFALDLPNRSKIKNLLQNSHPSNSILISYDTGSNFKEQINSIWKFIYPLLLGINDRSDLSLIKEIEFVDAQTKEIIDKIKYPS